MVKDYEYIEKPMGSSDNTAWHLKNHSTLEAFACDTLDSNASDPWANIRHLKTFCHLKVKGEKKWRHYHSEGNRVNVRFEYNGETINEEVCPDRGYLAVLYQLESPKYKERYEKSQRIRQIRDNIKEARKELAKLTR